MFAGVVVDRVDRRLLLVAANAARALALLGLAASLAAGWRHLLVLYAVMFALGMAETLVDNAALAVLPRLVDRDRLEWANGRIFAPQSVLDELVGPPLGGVFFAVSATVAFCTGSAAFALGAVLLLGLPGWLRAEQTPSHGGGGVWTSIGEGLRWFWLHRLLRTVAVMAGVVNLFSAATLAVLVLLGTSELGLGPGGYGLLLAGGAVGGIAAGLVAAGLVRRLGPGAGHLPVQPAAGRRLPGPGGLLPPAGHRVRVRPGLVRRDDRQRRRRHAGDHGGCPRSHAHHHGAERRERRA